MFESIKNKKIIVVGSGSGIGKQVAIDLGALGAKVSCISKTNAVKTSNIIGLNSIGIDCDITNENDVEASIEKSIYFLNGLDTIINVAGISTMSETHLESLDTFTETLSVNLFGTFLTCKYAIKYMLSHDGGNIINTGSVAGMKSLPWNSAYSASKAAVIRFTQSLAYEYRDKNIRANVICPGAVDTPLLRSMSVPTNVDYSLLGDFRNNIKIATVEEISSLYTYLCLNNSRYINGSIITIDGGLVC